MNASIIIPVWNGHEFLPTCLDALLGQGYADMEIIAVDNASTDDSAHLIAENYPQVHLISNDRNAGFAGGCNLGIAASQGDIVVLLNQDTRVLPGWLSALLDGFRDAPAVGVAGCKILYPDGTTLQHAGGWIEWPLGQAHHFGSMERDVGQWDTSRDVGYVTGASLAFRRRVIADIGLLDEGFWPGYFEDADFCFRARSAGYRVRYIPQAVLLHAETTSVTDPLLLSRFYQRGRLRFVVKHLPPQRVVTEFVPAEAESQLAAMRGRESAALRLAYLETIPSLPGLLRQCWTASDTIVANTITAFQALYASAWRTAWQIEEERIATEAHGPESSNEPEPLALPHLHEPQFTLGLRPSGRWVDRFARLFYERITAQALRDVVRQQEAINSQLRGAHDRQVILGRQRETAFRAHMEAVARQMAVLAEENAVLAKSIAQQNMLK